MNLKNTRQKQMSIKFISVKSLIYAFFSFAFFAWIVYCLPRYLFVTLGENSPWIGYFYTYFMGGIIFLSSTLWIFTRQKSVLRKREELFWLAALFFGLFFSLCLHGFWILFAVNFPLK